MRCIVALQLALMAPNRTLDLGNMIDTFPFDNSHRDVLLLSFALFFQ